MNALQLLKRSGRSLMVSGFSLMMLPFVVYGLWGRRIQQASAQGFSPDEAAKLVEALVWLGLVILPLTGLIILWESLEINRILRCLNQRSGKEHDG